MAWDALVGRKAKGDYYDPQTWEVFLQAGDVMSRAVVDRLDVLGLAAAEAELQGLSVDEEAIQRWLGWGRNKSAIAKAVLQPGSGELTVNGQPVWEYFREAPNKAQGFLRRLLEMDEVKHILVQMDVIVYVEGSSSDSMRQAKSVAHAIARALAKYDNRLKEMLKRAGFWGAKVKGH